MFSLTGVLAFYSTWLPAFIVLVAGFLLLKKLGVPRTHVILFVFAVVLGFILVPLVRDVYVLVLVTNEEQNSGYIASLVSMMAALSANVGPLVLLMLAIKARSPVKELTVKG
jgi:hypothetical protein